MPDFDDDFPDAEWTGRPQDDPRQIAILKAERAEFRRKHPPVNCWIDGVAAVELFQNGVVRARVERDQSLITYFDEQGQSVSTAIYLRSENLYDVVEAHLGIGRVAEIRDESAEAEEPISPFPREREEREAAEFRHRHFRDDEIFLYLRSAVGVLNHETYTGDLHRLAMQPLLEAVTAAILDQFEVSLAHVRNAADQLEKQNPSLLFGPPALANCRRAIVAIQRHIAIQGRLPIRQDGKSGG